MGNHLMEETVGKIRSSIIVKLGIIGVLILILLIPASMVESLIRERQYRKQDAVNEMSGKWGGEQKLTGPVITVPYTRIITDKKGKKHSETKYIHILPEKLKITGQIIPEIRYRGIYKAVLYSVDLKINGFFSPFKEQAIEMTQNDIQWDKAQISFGITDMKGIREEIELEINEKLIPLSPGGTPSSIITSGVTARLKTIDPSQKADFDIKLSLNGSQRISFIPVGKTTEVELTSEWDAPSFDGSYLPIKRSVSEKGFDAEWRIFEFNRDYPQIWTNSNYNVDNSAFGVKLFIGNDIYSQSMRTVKYAVLFIVFTFASIFISEIINSTRVHPFQYLLTGCAVTIFYVLLISFSEHLSFGLSYLISVCAIVGLVFCYIKCFFTKIIMPIVIALIQITLYVYFYITLQSEDYALLMGSLGLFTVLAVVMYVTRKINWDELSHIE